MSFDLFLQCFESGESAEADRLAVSRVLKIHNEDKPDDFGYYNVEFRDGSQVEFSARGLLSNDSFTGCAFNIRGFSKEILLFVYEVAVAGNMVIFNPQGSDEPTSPSVILVNASQRNNLPENSAVNPILCESTGQLSELLGCSFEGWKVYRDSLVNRIQ